MFYARSQFRLKIDGSAFNVRGLYAVSVLWTPLGLEAPIQFVRI